MTESAEEKRLLKDFSSDFNSWILEIFYQEESVSIGSETEVKPENGDLIDIYDTINQNTDFKYPQKERGLSSLLHQKIVDFFNNYIDEWTKELIPEFFHEAVFHLLDDYRRRELEFPILRIFELHKIFNQAIQSSKSKKPDIFSDIETPIKLLPKTFILIENEIFNNIGLIDWFNVEYWKNYYNENLPLLKNIEDELFQARKLILLISSLIRRKESLKNMNLLKRD